ncbi:HSP20-like chaperone [Auriculariales sp. MPI-PUGE-AT-0066]|nr:HSP20-like chaperone [Auriculariales sp. MPI-PUGE-AT-0066]
MKCSRSGCSKEYDPENNEEGSCVHHSGSPVFHEGLKSWSCCSDKNKPVLDFESFLAFPGCTVGKHTSQAPKTEVARSTGISNFKEPAQTPENGNNSATSEAPRPLPTVKPVAPKPIVYVEEEDDTSVAVATGVKCLRNGCKHTFVSDEVSRGVGPDAQCVYHPAPPLFREGSKGYMCCKRKVLEFEEFLKIEGCKQGRHLFVKKKTTDANGAPAEELVQCRLDHYQTPGQVHASIFAKKADKEKSKVVFTEQTVELDIVLPDLKRFVRTLNLYGPIQPAASTYTFFGTKVELLLAKQDNRSWNTLEKSDLDIGTFTFGVGGRTGSVGGQAPVLDQDNKIRTTS